MFWFWSVFLGYFGRNNRGIFRFWNGRRWVGVDPIPVARALLSHPEFAWDETPKLTDDPDVEVAADAIRISAAAVRDAFGIKPLEQGGLTEAECCQILWAFREYLGIVKKNGSGPLISPEPTESAASDNESLMNAGSDSGSTGSESVTSGPGKLWPESTPAVMVD